MKKRFILPVLSTLLLMSIVFPASAFAEGVNAKVATNVGVQYITHIQDKGWETVWKTNGALSGTVGEGKRLEGLKVKLTGDYPDAAKIQAYVHVQDEGDLGPFEMGENAGTEGKGLRLERIRLVLKSLPGYELRYNVQVQNRGWLRDANDDSTWFVSGETAGTTGEGLRLEAIKIKVVETNEELVAYYAALATVNEDDYTTASWTAYQKVVDTNVVTESNTSEEIIAATEAIIAAQAKLAELADLTAYNQVLAAVDETDYTTASWAVYEKIVNANQVTEENTQNAVDKATAAISAAQSNLVKGKNLVAYKAALAAADEADYTTKTWLIYQRVVKANVVTLADTQTRIDSATTKILAAQKELQAKVDITEYVEALAAVDEFDYTPVSWIIYQEVVDANVVSLRNTQTEVDEATDNITDAQKALVKKFDFSTYNDLLNSVDEDDYTSLSWAAYEIVAAANDDLDENDTQTDIEEAIALIEAAQAKLVKAGDLSFYEVAVALADKEDYTTASWVTYQKVLDANIVTKDDTQTVIDTATAKILAAQDKLVPIGDMSDYYAAIADVDEADWTTVSWTAYQKVVKANAVSALSGQTAIDAATLKIIAAQAKLVEIGDITAYTAALAKVTSANWTTASWATYQKVVKANVVTVYSGQSVIDSAAAKILAAQDKLAVLGDLTAYQKVLKATDGKTYTTASWATYQKVVKANVVTTDSGQTLIDAAVKKIETAQDKLVEVGDLTVYLATLAKYADKEASYTAASWATYQKVVDANVMDEDKSQAVIDAAVVKIVAAQKKLVAKATSEEFAAYQTAFNAKIEADYTVTSWAVYKKVLLANIMTTANSTAEIVAATNKINAAQYSLVAKGDLTVYELYQDAITAYADQEDYYTTTSWTKYLVVLDANDDLTRENTTTEIKDATTKITTAQAKLIKGPELKYYNQVIANYADRESEFTAESWATYQEVILANLVTKDNTQAEVNAAMTIIQTAQKSLKSVTDLTAFQEAISLYQENKIAGNVYSANATTASWKVYSDLVEQYASFDSSWTWVSAGGKSGDITQSTALATVTSVTGLMNQAIEDFVFVSDFQTAYAAYQIAITTDELQTYYTVYSYNMYAAAIKANALPDPVVKATTASIVSATKNINYAKSGLIKRADTDAFETAVATYEKRYLRMSYNDTTKVYDASKSWYTLASWDDYETVYKKYTVDASTALDPDNDIQTTYDSATAELIAAGNNLVYSSAYVVKFSQIETATFDEQNVGDNIIDKAAELIDATAGLESDTLSSDEYTITFTRIDSGSAVINSTGEITDIGSGSATVTFTIAPKDNSATATTSEVIISLK